MNFPAQLAQAQHLREIFFGHPLREFTDGQLVIVPPGRVSIVQSATPTSLDGSTLTWLYRCPFVDRPEIGEYFEEASLIDLDQRLLAKLLFSCETHPLAYLFEVKA
jgi:hypothetical protein